MKHFLAFIIRLYQKTVSPDHGFLRFRFPYGYCRFYPSCSDYSRQAIMSHGAVYGGYLSIKRIASCNPWNNGGIDQVPRNHAILRHK